MFVALAAMLYVLAFAMIGIGGYLAADGSQILTIERGVAYYTGGLGLVTGGLVVFGIATLVLCLGTIHRAIKQGQLAGVAPIQPAMAPFTESAPIMPVAPSMSAVVEPVVFAETPASLQSDYVAVEPVRRDEGPGAAIYASGVTMEPYSSGPEPAPEYKPYAFEPGATAHSTETKSEAAYYSVDLPSKEPLESESAVALSSEAYVALPPAITYATDASVAEPEIEAAKVVEEVQPTPSVTVVGSYESGGNRYIMYSDGSIDAHLPSGVRTFLSLDELKQFVSTSVPA